MNPEQIHRAQQEAANAAANATMYWDAFQDFAGASHTIKNEDTSLHQVLERLRKDIKYETQSILMPDGNVEEHIVMPKDNTSSHLILKLMNNPKQYQDAVNHVLTHDYDLFRGAGQENRLYHLLSLVQRAEYEG